MQRFCVRMWVWIRNKGTGGCVSLSGVSAENTPKEKKQYLMRGCKFSRMDDKQLKGNINILRKQCITKEELPFSSKRPWTVNYRRKDQQVLYWVNFSHNEIKSSIKWMPGLLELLSCLISSLFPGTVMNLVVHMMWSSPETWTSMHLVVWSLSSRSISSSFTETDFSRNLLNHNWLSYLTNLKTKYKKKKEKKQAKKGMNHISLIHFFILFCIQLSN